MSGDFSSKCGQRNKLNTHKLTIEQSGLIPCLSSHVSPSHMMKTTDGVLRSVRRKDSRARTEGVEKSKIIQDDGSRGRGGRGRHV